MIALRNFLHDLVANNADVIIVNDEANNVSPSNSFTNRSLSSVSQSSLSGSGSKKCRWASDTKSTPSVNPKVVIGFGPSSSSAATSKNSKYSQEPPKRPSSYHSRTSVEQSPRETPKVSVPLHDMSIAVTPKRKGSNSLAACPEAKSIANGRSPPPLTSSSSSPPPETTTTVDASTVGSDVHGQNIIRMVQMLSMKAAVALTSGPIMGLEAVENAEKREPRKTQRQQPKACKEMAKDVVSPKKLSPMESNAKRLPRSKQTTGKMLFPAVRV